jgi:hypothetical protein
MTRKYQARSAFNEFQKENARYILEAMIEVFNAAVHLDDGIQRCGNAPTHMNGQAMRLGTEVQADGDRNSATIRLGWGGNNVYQITTQRVIR